MHAVLSESLYLKGYLAKMELFLGPFGLPASFDGESTHRKSSCGLFQPGEDLEGEGPIEIG